HASSATVDCSAFVTLITETLFLIFANPRFSSSVPDRIRVRSRSRGIVFLRAEATVRGYFYFALRDRGRNASASGRSKRVPRGTRALATGIFSETRRIVIPPSAGG